MTMASELKAHWTDPPAIYRGAPFWSWNAKLDPRRLCRAIESMHAAGMGGFFMHSRYGLKTAYLSGEWFECVRACVEKARELGMKAYLYDEDRWPSGTAGGLVTREREDYRAHALVARAAGEGAAGEYAAAEELARFAVLLDDEGRLRSYRALAGGAAAEPEERAVAFDVVVPGPSPWFNDGNYLDTLNAEAVAEFVHVTHQAYADRFGGDFGELIPAIFTDEPNYGHACRRSPEGWAAAAWTADLPREFIQRRGYDLRDHLPKLIFPLAAGEFSKVRYDYRRTLTELFAERFSEQIGQWCEAHHIALTGHYLSEQTLGSQADRIGAAMPHYRHMQWPGIDILTDQCHELATAKQCASVADQLGKARVLSEMYGCTGWDWPLEGHKFVGDWQYAAGVNFRCPHLTHYSLAGGAKRDFPASIFAHSPWWGYYAAVEDYFARLGLMLTQGRPIREVLLIHPVESAWGAFVGGGVGGERLEGLQEQLREVIYTLSWQHYGWDFADESLLAEGGKATQAGLKLGYMTYRLVVVPPCLTLRATTVKLLRKFLAGGGKVLFVGEPPERVDGEKSEAAGELAAAASHCPCEAEEMTAAVESLIDRRVSIADGGGEVPSWHMLRAVKGGRLLFVQSHDRAAPRRAAVRVEGSRPVVLWDARTARRHRLDARDAGEGYVEFELSLPPTGSALVSLGVAVDDAEPPAAEPAVAETRTFAGPFDVELTEPNTMPLDYCRFRVGEEEFSQPVPVLKADALIRARYGLGTRLGREHQPWYLYATGAVDTAPRDRCELKWTFHVSELPGACRLALEGSRDFEVTVNGKLAGHVDGWWVDEDIETIDITPLLEAGENEVRLAFDYRPDMELEDVYLVGDFATAALKDAPLAPGNVTMTAAPPKRLALGSWVGQGLNFYTGSVRYHLAVEGRAGGGRVRLRLPGVACTAAAVHVGEQTFVLPWPPFEADITDALAEGANDVVVEVIGGRKNILGPLHTPWVAWTGPGQFDPDNEEWTDRYLLSDHGLTEPVVVEVLK
jgi:hypothetical protein